MQAHLDRALTRFRPLYKESSLPHGAQRGLAVQRIRGVGGARRPVTAAATAGGGGDEEGAPLELGDWRSFKAKLIADAERAAAPGAAAPPDLAPRYGDDTRADVKLRLVLRSDAPSPPPSPRARRSSRRGGAKASAGGASGADADWEESSEGEESTIGAEGQQGEGEEGDANAGQQAAAGDGGATRPRTRSGGRRVVGEMPGHTLLLREASGWVQERLANCAASELEVEVSDEREAAAAEILLQIIYSTADPGRPLRGAKPDTLLRVLRLAGRLQVPAAVRAAGAALISSRRRPLAWDATVAAFELQTDGVPGMAAAARALRNAASDALQAELGDLDLAWLDSRRAARLTSLPFEAMRSLLSDGRTRAVSEATVFYTADAWLAANGKGTAEQRAALASCIRLPHVRLPYLVGVIAVSPWYTESVGADQITAGISYALAAPRIASLATSAVETPSARHAAWELPARPASEARRLRLEWAVPLSVLKRLFRAAQREGAEEIAAPQHGVWDGMRWALEVQSVCEEDDGVSFGLFVTPAPPPLHPPAAASGADRTAPACITFAKISLDAPSARRKLRAGGRMQLLLGREGRGFNDFFELGGQMEWDEAVWRDAGLVSADDTVRVVASVREVA